MDVYLSQEIKADGEYVDKIISQIASIPKGEDLRMLITCVGGNTFQGDRIYRAILEHSGKTHAVVIGCAISMGAAMLSAFDTVEIDEGAELMFHKAGIQGENPNEYDDEDLGIINRFNAKAYKRMKARGVDAKFLADVFLSDSNKNHWITPKEAESLGIGKVTTVKRKSHEKSFDLAASLDLTKYKNNKMNLFKKAIPRVVNLKDGRTAIFESKEEIPKVGDTLILAGSAETLKGTVKLENNLVAQLDNEGKVEAMEEMEEPENMVSVEEFEALKAAVAEIKEMLLSQGENMKEEKEAEDMEKKEAEDMKEKEYEDKIEATNSLLNKAIAAVKDIKTTFEPKQYDNKHEQVNEFNGLSDSEKRAIELRKAINE